MPKGAKRGRSLKRVSLRSLLVLMTVCCLGFAFWSAQVEPLRRQHEANKMVVRLGGVVASSPIDASFWHRWVLDEEAIGWTVAVKLPYAIEFQPGDARRLAAMPRLERLDIAGSNIGDGDLAALARLDRLTELSLKYCQIGDAGVADLGEKPNLRRLVLTGCEVSDASIDKLASFGSLQELFIRWTRVTPEGAKRLSERLPDCVVLYRPRGEAS